MSNQTPQNDVLTLHSSIGDRWQGEDSVGTAIGDRHDRPGLVDRTLANLPGLASLQGSFGIDAWDLASMLAMDNKFMAAGGLSVRSMSIAELADIVQIILEEEEDLNAEWAEYERLSKSSKSAKAKAAQRKVVKKVRKAAPGMAARVAAVRRAVAQARKAAAARVQQQRATRIAEARARVESLRQQGADPVALDTAIIDLAQAESATFEPATGDFVSTPPGAVETADPGLPTLRSMLRVARRDPATIGMGQRMADTQSGTIAELQPTAAAGAIRWQQMGTRALRMADTTAELAMLQPAAEQAWAQPAASTASMSTPAQSLFARQVAPAAAPITATAASGAASLPTRAWGNELTAAAPVSAQEVAAFQQVQRLARIRAYAAPTSAPIASLGSTPRAPVTHRGIATPAGIARTQAGTTAPAGPTAPFATASAPAMTPALFAATNLTSRQLTARVQSLRAMAPQQTAHTVLGQPGTSAPGQLPTAAQAAAPTAISRWLATSAGASSDPFAALFGPLEIPLTTGTERWLAATEAGAGAPVRQGYAAHDLGGGDTLRLGTPEIFDASLASAEAAQVRAPIAARAAATAARGARSTTAPSWLTPAAARSIPAAATSRQLAQAAARATVPTTTATPAASAPTGTPVPQTFASTVAPRLAGSTATDAVSLARNVSERLLRGVEPATSATQQGPTWRPMREWQTAGALPATVAASAKPAGASVAGAHRFMQQVAGSGMGMFARGDVTTAESPWLAAAMVADTDGGTSFITPARVAELRGAIAQMQGAGEWLLPGDEGFDTWREMAAVQTADRISAPARTIAQAAARAATSPAARRSATAAPASPAAAARRVAPTSGASVAPAASAAIERFLATQTRLSGKALSSPEFATASTSFSAMSLASADDSLLGLAPHDASDAMTPWLVARAVAGLPAEQARQFRFASDASIEMLALQPGEDAPFTTTDAGQPVAATQRRAGTAPAAASATSTPTTATSPTAWVAGQRARLERVLRQPSLREAVRRIGGGALDTATPAGLNAALALFGEADRGASDAELGDRFVKRFFGRVAKPARRARVGTAELTSLRPTATAPSIGAASDAAAGPSGDREIVFEGLSGLAALDMFTRGESTEAMMKALGGVEQTLVQPGADAPEARDSASSPTAKARAARGSKPATSVSTHRFTPVALQAGRKLLGRGRRSRSLLTRSPQSARSFRQRTGYGAAALGGGGLVGLQAGDSGASFHGGYSDARTSRRAERMSSAVMARRGTRPGQLGRSLSSPAGGRQLLRSSQTPGGLPANFDFSAERSLVDTKAAEPQVIERTRVVHMPAPTSMRYDPRKPASQGTRAAVQSAAASSMGGAASAKSTAAASMARVLSVTAAPTANILPLVAPAARAVASAAAAKGLSEGVQMATSGANPAMIAPMAGHDIQGQTAGGPGQGSTEKERAESGGTPAQELDQLAMKIARSVMVRIKRERERRGIYG